MKSSALIIFIVLLYINFFGILDVSNTMLLASLLPFIAVGINKKNIFNEIFICFIIGLICNFISCYYYNGQDFLSSFKAVPNYLYILSFYLFFLINPTLRALNKAILYLIIIFDVIYILQFILLQVGMIFLPLDKDTFADIGNDARFRMVAGGLVSLGMFYGCNRYVLKKDAISILVFLLSFIVVILMAFRTMIFCSIIISILLIIRLQGFSKKTIMLFVFSFIAFILLLNVPIISEKMDYMLEKQFGSNAETFSNKDYIRNVTLFYYLKLHFKSVAEYFFGSGMPFINHPYHHEMDDLNSQGIFYQDWGLLGLSWMLGVIPVFCMIWYSVKAALIKVDKSYYYIGAWFIYLIISSITTAEFFREGNFVIQSLCLYIIYRANVLYINELRYK